MTTNSFNFADATVAEIDAQRYTVAGGFRADLHGLRGSVGLYFAVLQGEIMAIGVATEGDNRGIPKRIRDFSRPSPSGRRHHIGRMIHANLDRLDLELIVVGKDRAARILTPTLLKPLIELHRPVWQVPEPVVAAAMDQRRLDRSKRSMMEELAA